MLPNSNQWVRLHERLKGRRWADFLSDDDSSFSFAQSHSKKFVGASQSTVHASRLGSVQLLQPDMSGSRGVFGSMSQSQRRNGVEQVLPPTESKLMSMMLSSSDENRFLTNRPKEGGSSHWRTINELPQSGVGKEREGQSGVPQRKFPNGFAGIMTHLSASEDNVNLRVSSKEHKADGLKASGHLLKDVKGPQDCILQTGGSDLTLVPAEVASSTFSKPSAGAARRRLMPSPLTAPMISDSAGMIATKLTTVLPPKSPQSPVIMASDSLSVSASSSSRFSSALLVNDSQLTSQRSASAFSNFGLPNNDPTRDRRPDSSSSAAMRNAAQLPIAPTDSVCPSSDEKSVFDMSLAVAQEANGYQAHSSLQPRPSEAQSGCQENVDIHGAEQDTAYAPPQSAPPMPNHPMGQWPGWHPGYWPFPMPTPTAAPPPNSAYPPQGMPYPPMQPPFMPPPWLPYYYPHYPTPPQQGLYMPPSGNTPYPYPPAPYPWGYGPQAAPPMGMPGMPPMPMPSDAYYAQQQMEQYRAYCLGAQVAATHTDEQPNLQVEEATMCVESQNYGVGVDEEDELLPNDFEGESSPVVLFSQQQDRAPCQFQFGSVDIEQLGGMELSNAHYPLTSVPEEDAGQGMPTSMPAVMLLPPATEVSVTTPDPSKTVAGTDLIQRTAVEKLLAVERTEEHKGSGTATHSTAVGAPSSGSFRLQDTDDDVLLTASASKQEFKRETYDQGRDKTPSAAFPVVAGRARFGDNVRGGQQCNSLSACGDRTAVCDGTGPQFPPLVEENVHFPSHVDRPANAHSKTGPKRRRGARNNERTTTEAVYAFGLTSSTQAQREPKLASKAKRRQARRTNGTKLQQRESDSVNYSAGVDETVTNNERFKAVSDANSINAKDASGRYTSGLQNVPMNVSGSVNEAVEQRRPFKGNNQQKQRKDDIRSLAAELWKQDLSNTTAVSGPTANNRRNSYGGHYNYTKQNPTSLTQLTKLPAFPLAKRDVGAHTTAQECAVAVPPPPPPPPRHFLPSTTGPGGGRNVLQRAMNELSSPNTDARRLRHIEKVMASADYIAYNRAVPRGMRRNSDPSTPSTKGNSHRSFLDALSIWKVQLKAFANTAESVDFHDIAPQGAAGGAQHLHAADGDATSAYRRRSLLREFAFGGALH